MSSDLCTKCEARVALLEKQVRALLEQASPPAINHDPRVRRRNLLRWAQRRFYPFASRDAAARAISLDWREVASARTNSPPEHGTREWLFTILIAGGCQPLGHRSIVDDLDPTFD
jgi:hypothetical protein